MISPLSPPTASDDCRGLWIVVARIVKLLNALMKMKVRAAKRNAFTWGDSDASLEFIPGGGTGTTAATPALTVVAASDAQHLNRVRVYAGTLGGLLPAGMSLLADDANPFYLTLSSAQPVVYGKVLVDQSSGRFTSAAVYPTNGEDADGTYVYLQIAVAAFGSDGSMGAITQLASGNQSLLVVCSADGTVLSPLWNRVS